MIGMQERFGLLHLHKRSWQRESKSIFLYTYLPTYPIYTPHLTYLPIYYRKESWSSTPVADASTTFFTPAKLDHQVGR